MEIGVYVVITIFIITYTYSFYVAPNPKIPQVMKDMHHSCVYGCSTENCRNVVLPRGRSLILEDISEEERYKLSNCSFTFWNLSHYLMYTVITSICPEYALQFFALGILFEGYEWYKYDCHDYMDIFANTSGIITGLAIRGKL
jgi:hypothetical protein